MKRRLSKYIWDSLLAQRLHEEEELTEQQKKRKSELSKSMLGSDLQEKILKREWLDICESMKRSSNKDSKKTERRKRCEAKDDELTKKSGKRRNQMARKGMHTTMKTPRVLTYKDIKQGEKGVYQIVREDGTDIVYINFGAMLKSISRDDLTELYRIVMNRYGMDGPEDKLEKGFWKCLRIMFEEPLSTDSIWSELGQLRL
ncbi:hypothetical protein Tco_0472302 [Tanacetum coccineum]